jgi:hypothetical protein
MAGKVLTCCSSDATQSQQNSAGGWWVFQWQHLPWALALGQAEWMSIKVRLLSKQTLRCGCGTGIYLGCIPGNTVWVWGTWGKERKTASKECINEWIVTVDSMLKATENFCEIMLEPVLELFGQGEWQLGTYPNPTVSLWLRVTYVQVPGSSVLVPRPENMCKNRDQLTHRSLIHCLAQTLEVNRVIQVSIWLHHCISHLND